MEIQNAAVGHRMHELRCIAAQLRWERSRRPARPGGGRLATVRIALGWRLVAAGTALLERGGARMRAPTP